MGDKRQHCSDIRARIETCSADWGDAVGRGAGNVGRDGVDDILSDDILVQRHVADCSDCAGYLALQRWSRRVLLAGEVSAEAPLMSAVWASIHRASEQAWDRALARSFRNLIPYMVAIVALILLVGGLSPSPAPTPVQAANSAYSVLNAPQVPAVAGVMTTASLPSEDPVLLIATQP